MDVTCERCSTAYEFDDALVSERGTTVKCTNCGHQFRIRRQDAVAGGAPERWVVRTVDGRELEFRALRELQGAIAAASITREDVLSRGATRPRRLGSIAELEPFFANAAANTVAATASGVGPRTRVPTPQGLGAVAPARHEGSVAIPLPTASPGSARVSDEDAAQPTLSPRRPGSMPSYDAAVARSLPVGDPVPIGDISEAIVTRVRGGLDAARAVPSAVATARVPVEPPAPAATGMAPDAGPTPAPRPRVVVEPAAQEARARSADKTLPVPVVSPLAAPEPEPEFAAQGTASWGTPRESRLSDGRYSEVLHGEPLRQTPTPSNVRASFTNEDYAEPRFSSLAPPRRAGAARWIVGFVLSGIVVLGALTVGKKLFVTAGAQQADPSSDARVARLLQDGEKAFSEGDLEGAQEQFDRASAFADKDPKVAAALARLAVVRADVTWLKTKLLAADDPDLPGARKMLAADAARARKAADRAAELAPKDATSVRTRIDALREAGDTAAARKLVPDVAGVMSQPETGTTLAALDLAEEKVDWPTVIGRLRTAVDADGNLGRARALLVYALARSGDAAAAKAELDRLQALPRPHPLMQALRAYVARAGQSVDLSQLPEVGTEVPADWHEALKLAAAAKQKGDTRRVEALLAAAVDKSHGDPEALTAQADEKWETGDKDGALALYKKVAAKAPAASAWARHAKERLEAKSTKERSSPLEEAMPAEHRARREREREHQPEPEPEPEPPTPPPTPAPGGTIDTSDLPGVKAPPPAAPEATQAPAKQQPPAAPPAQTPSTPPGVDTSDLPGYK